MKKIDWAAHQRVLVDASERVLRLFLSRYPEGEVCAVGFVFELCNASPQFDLCADTQTNRRRAEQRYRASSSDTDMDEVRWNSGSYQFPAGLGTARDELGSEWNEVSALLHSLSLADNDEQIGEVYTGIIGVCSNSLIELAVRGILGDWTNLDFNVAEVLDDIEVIKERDLMIRSAIAD